MANSFDNEEFIQTPNYNERDKYNEFPSLVQAITDNLDFRKWDFEIKIFPAGTLGDFSFSSAIIFQSEFCKLRFWTFRDRPYEDPEIYFTYGRLHAPDEKHTMTWNGREYHCWHDHLFLYIMLGYLDGLSPEEIAKSEFPYFPTLILNFNKEGLGTWGQQERYARFHNTIWNHYGQRLFDLFDIRKPNLWDQYMDFYQEFRLHVASFEYIYKSDVC
jgi:hypothetical protein